MRACGDTTLWRFRFVALTLLATGAWGWPVVALAQAEIPPEVRQALENNARSFAPIALTLEKQRSVPEPPTTVATKLLDRWTGFVKPCTYEYLSQDGMCYARFNTWVRSSSTIPGTDKVKEGVSAKWAEMSWNGKCVYRGMPSMEPRMLSIVPIEKAETDIELKRARWYAEDDYFGMVGIAVPRAMKELPAGPQSEVLALLVGDALLLGTRKESLAGAAEHFVVELQSGQKKHRFWLDPSLGHAVRRHEVWSASGALAVAIDNSDFVKLTSPDLWLPRHCRAEWHTWPVSVDQEFTRQPSVVVDVQATRLERARVPPEKFTLNYDKPGTAVADARLPGADKSEGGRIDYRVPADPKDLDEAIRAAQERSGYAPLRRPLFVWVIGISIAFGVLAGVIVLIRRRQQRPTTP